MNSMQILDIDQLIRIARDNPAEFASRKAVLVGEAIRSSDNPEIARRLQSALSFLEQGSAGEGCAAFRATLAALDNEFYRQIGDIRRTFRHGPGQGAAVGMRPQKEDV